VRHVHDAALGEFIEYWEDMHDAETGSRALLLLASPRWGRRRVLDAFSQHVERDDLRLGAVIRIPGYALHDSLAVQVSTLTQRVVDTRLYGQTAEEFGVDTLGGVIERLLGVASLVVSLPVTAAMLLASVGLSVLGKSRDFSRSGPLAKSRRLASRIARVSSSLVTVVVVDDLDRIDPELAVIFVRCLLERPDGRVLVAASLEPESDVARLLLSIDSLGMVRERIRTVDVPAAMGPVERRDLADDLLGRVPVGIRERVAERSQTFADVFAVASTPAVNDLVDILDEAEAIGRIDRIFDAVVRETATSSCGVVCAWAGGALHRDQWSAAAPLLGADSDDETGTIAFGPLIRLAGPVTTRLAERIDATLDRNTRERVARELGRVAGEIGDEVDRGLVERIVALRVAHNVRRDLVDPSNLANLQLHLVLLLEDIGDIDVARTVAQEALDGQPETRADLDSLRAAVIRLQSYNHWRYDPIVESIIERATSSGAVVDLEARVWTAVALLNRPDSRELAIHLVEDVADELNTRDHEPMADRWRLLLAFHAGANGLAEPAQRIVAALLTEDADPETTREAERVLRTAGEPQADLRLGIALLQRDLAALALEAEEDRLGVADALADLHGRLGEYRDARAYAEVVLMLRRRLQGDDHPDTLGVRLAIARWTERAGDAPEALRMFRALLLDQERVAGPHHPSTLAVRNGIAQSTGEAGDPREAVRLFRQLLLEAQQAFGAGNPNVLIARSNIALWAAEAGDIREALQLSRDILPELQEAVGVDHRDVLKLRSNIVQCTGEDGNAPEAARLAAELLPDAKRIFGTDHPDTLTVRADLALWTGASGDREGALHLFQELLPDQVRIRGEHHPNTLRSRSNMALMVGKLGDVEEGLRLLRELLPEEERVLGINHPNTVKTRSNIAAMSAEVGRST
jgi:tetratricopeptide (TPR) repeat protein